MKKTIFTAVFFLQGVFSMDQPLLRGSTISYYCTPILSNTEQDLKMYFRITESSMFKDCEIPEYCCRVVRQLAPYGSFLRNISIEKIKKYRKIFDAMKLKTDFPYETEYRVVKIMIRTKPVVKIADHQLNLALNMFIPEKPEEDELEDIDKTKVPKLTPDNVCTLRATRFNPQLSAELDEIYDLSELMKGHVSHLAAINLFSYMVKKITPNEVEKH
ncbi:MAG: hypothetical protein LBJ96_05360 [Holosporaceae bacterium]|jgi:hypothetical protein|nr:hypothetical protein [Holosporaceae bacterium]